MAKIGIREAVRLAKENAAALIDCSDLAQLYGDDYDEENEDVLSEAQFRVAEMLRKSIERKSVRPAEKERGKGSPDGQK